MAVLKIGAQDDAAEIKYENTQTALHARNVQAAIDELFDVVQSYKSATVTEINRLVPKNTSSSSSDSVSWREMSSIIFFKESQITTPKWEKVGQSPF